VLWGLLGLRAADWRAAAEYGGKLATPKQLDALARFGVGADGELTRAAASQLLDAVITRARAGLATPKQLRLLVRRGLGGATTTRQEASEAVDALAARGWR
jgi:hypothetical protein